MNDSFYTPQHIAEHLIGLSSLESVHVIADFAAGDGALLDEATKRWPSKSVVATDISVSAVRQLRLRHPAWQVSKCDFLNSRSRDRSSALKALARTADLIVLNPPYSCRGASKCDVEVAGELLRCSRALAFVITATQYLHSDGELVAILPQSCFTSHKDRDAWAYLHERYKINTGFAAGRGEFPGCFARCNGVCLSPRSRTKKVRGRSRSTAPPTVSVKLVRGCVPLYKDAGTGRTLVHSTDLVRSKVVLNGHVAGKDKRAIIGPCVLIPRVGKPNIGKVALYLRNKRVALSDCVIGLQCDTRDEAEWLHAAILQHGDDFLMTYSGTCAPYTTVERLTTFLEGIGCSATFSG